MNVTEPAGTEPLGKATLLPKVVEKCYDDDGFLKMEHFKRSRTLIRE